MTEDATFARCRGCRTVLMVLVTIRWLTCVDVRGLAAEMDDPQIHGTIEQLGAEEHEL